MKNLKKYAKYIIWLVAFYLFTQFLIFVALNSNYKPIEVNEVSEQIVVEKAEATKSHVKVYGKIKNSQGSDLNGKYIKITAYNSNNNEITSNYIKIENIASDEKSFQANFAAKDAKSCGIYIVKNK